MKEFPIPTLTKKSWDELQKYLNDLGRNINKLDAKGYSKELTECHILLGLIDMVLGREYSFEEVMESLKKEVTHRVSKDMWVVSSNYKTLLCDPPKFVALIKHYHDDKGIVYEDLRRCCKETDKIFDTKELAEESCKDMGFYSWDVIDVDIDEKAIIKIGDDYE